MSNVAIVAIPEKTDYVNKISSEKIPHMTLLLLGETDKIKHLNLILGFVQHAVNQSCTKFGLDIEMRGVLGDNLADVLFVSKNRWSGFDEIKSFRSYLLKNDAIKAAYDSVEQFSEWNPHITLGYPDTPAKVDERDFPGITYVQFDRIAVWTGDFEGTEFSLKPHEWSSEVAIMGNDKSSIVEDILEHHGIKGMKWGVQRAVDKAIGTKTAGRRPTKSTNSSKPSRSIRRADKKFEKGAQFKTRSGFKNMIAIHNAAAEASDKHIARINAKPEYVKAIARGDFLDPNKTITKKYYKEQADAYLGEVNKAAAAMGTNASGTRKYEVVRTSGSFGWGLTTTEVKHDNSGIIELEPIFDDKGVIIKFKTISDSITQSSLLVDNILEHHGIKGMKWGRRSSGKTAVTVADKRKKIKTSGGEGHPAHADAIRARTSGQIAKKSGLKALSNQELQAYNQRLNLEKQAKTLTFQDKSKGRQFVSNLIGKGVKSSVDQGTRSAITSDFVKKKAAIGAAALALA